MIRRKGDELLELLNYTLTIPKRGWARWFALFLVLFFLAAAAARPLIFLFSAPARWWTLGALAAVLLGVRIRIFLRDRALKSPAQVGAPAWTCRSCGYALAQIPLRDEPVEGIRVHRPTCPECGHRQF